MERGPVVFAREVCTADLMAELMPLFELHYLEIAHYKDIPLEIDVARYLAIEAQNALRFYVARVAGKSVGYAIYIVNYNLHYMGSLQAAQDVIFIEPVQRGFGQQFIQWCDDRLHDDGVQVVAHHIKAAHNFGPMLERMGYELVDLIYSRRL